MQKMLINALVTLLFSANLSMQTQALAVNCPSCAQEPTDPPQLPISTGEEPPPPPRPPARPCPTCALP